ncbi:MAG: hypothetical protein K9G44_09575 [Melioribacteraceae bacterium]|nr:hypothetical protein [Melioribacteraceae bacterium]
MNSFGKGISGNKTQLETLQKIYNSNKVPHAILFSGLQGCGKFAVAMEFALLANQKSILKNPSVQAKLTRLEEPFVKFIFQLPRGKGELSDDLPFAKLSNEQIENIREELNKKIANPYYQMQIEKANNIKVTSIREIRKFLANNYDDIETRFVIINDAHLMNAESQNALLKNLEEPPPGNIFILITHHKNYLLPTIKSRCWQIDFSPLSEKDVSDILVNRFEIDKQIADKVSHFSDGSVTQAINLIENDFEYMIDSAITILRYSLGRRYNTALNKLNEILENNGKVTFRFILLMILKWLNDVIRNKIANNNYYFSNHSETLIKFNKNFPKADLQQISINIEKYISSMDNNVHLNVISANVIFELATIAIRK